MKKAAYLSLIFIFLPSAIKSFAQSIVLDPIVIEKYGLVSDADFGRTLSQKQLEMLPYFSPEELPGYLPGVELQKRAPFGVQQDLSIRGSVFEDNVVRLEGIDLSNPQTGHFNLEIPVTSADIEKVAVSKNRQQLSYSLAQPGKEGALLRTSFGQHALWENLLSVNFPLGKTKNRVSAEHKVSSGGRPDTDFQIYNFSLHSLWQELGREAEFIFGSTKRDFGAGIFYHPALLYSEEKTTQRFFLLRGKLKEDLFNAAAAVYFRRHTDEFNFDRHNPLSAVNNHTTYIYGLENKVVFKNNIFFDLAWRGEEINSTMLRRHSRRKKSFSLGVDEARIGDFIYQGSAGFSYYRPWSFLEEIHLDLGYFLKENLLLNLSYDRLWRPPSFTELHYDDGSFNIGNPSLKVQKSHNYELGLKFEPSDNLSFSADLFLRRQSNTIDWVKNTNVDPWEAKNIGSMDVRGFDFYGGADFNGWLDSVGLGYTYLDLSKGSSYTFSKYVFDYSRHKILVNFGFNLGGAISSLIMNYSRPVYRDSYVTLDLKVRKKISDFEVSLEGVNIFNQGYEEKIDIPGTGRWYKLSLTYNF